ncbi:unnamed protein product [Penicillium pancosmium]
MRQNIADLRKRRELIELQAQFEAENRLFEEAQRRLEAMRAPAPESHGVRAHANSNTNINANANAATQTPSKQSTTTNGPSALLSPHMGGGFTIKGTAHTQAVDQFMDSLQGDMGRAESELPPIHEGGSANGGLRSTSQPVLTPIETPRKPGHRPQSQHSRRPSGPVNPLSLVAERVAEVPCLTVIHPKTRSLVSEAESGSEKRSHSTMMSEERDSDEWDAPLSRRTQRLQHPGPEPSVPKYEAESWPACLKLMQVLEMHFSMYPEFYSFEDRKVQLGEKYLCATFASEWDDRRRKLQGPSWVAFCLFLAEQLAKFVKPDVARRNYTSTYQKQAECVISMTEFYRYSGTEQEGIGKPSMGFMTL